MANIRLSVSKKFQGHSRSHVLLSHHFILKYDIIKLKKFYACFKIINKKTSREKTVLLNHLREILKTIIFFIRFESYGSRKNLPSVTDHYYFLMKLFLP